MRTRPWLLLTIVALLTTALVAFAACGGDDDDDESPTATTAAGTAAPTSPAGETPAATEPADGPFEGAQDPVEGALGDVPDAAPPVATVVRVEAAGHEGYDRIVFEIEDAGANYSVEYVEDPTDCGSGEPTFPSGGSATYLQITIRPANAHDESGASTIESLGLSPDLPAIKRAKQSCDFEAVVSWVVLVDEPLDFRVTEVDSPLRLAVDIAHP